MDSSGNTGAKTGHKWPNPGQGWQKSGTTLLSFGTSWRSVALADYGPLIADLERCAGVSRYARIEGLGGFRVPIYSGSRPSASISVTVVGGKGCTAPESRLSALFEAVELAVAERPLVTMTMTEQDLESQGQSYISSASLASAPCKEAFPWIQVENYETGEPIWAPYAAVTMERLRTPFMPTSNGLASGLDPDEAILHGLLEILERHAFSFALIHRDGVSLDIESVEDDLIRDLLRQARENELRFEIKDISRTVGLPTYFALVLNAEERDSHMVGGGLGCHIDPMISIRRAMLEAVQSRVVTIAGGREDLEERRRVTGQRFVERSRMHSYWYEPTGSTVPIPPSVSPNRFANFREAVLFALQRARQADPDLGRLLVHRFATSAPLAVVRSLLGGAELFSLAQNRRSPRIQKIFDGIL